MMLSMNYYEKALEDKDLTHLLSIDFTYFLVSNAFSKYYTISPFEIQVGVDFHKTPQIIIWI